MMDGKQLTIELFDNLNFVLLPENEVQLIFKA